MNNHRIYSCHKYFQLFVKEFVDRVFDDVNDNIGNFLDLGQELGGKVRNQLEAISNPEDWVLGLHQVLLFFLVLGRWMLPRGGIRFLVLTFAK